MRLGPLIRRLDRLDRSQKRGKEVRPSWRTKAPSGPFCHDRLPGVRGPRLVRSAAWVAPSACCQSSRQMGRRHHVSFWPANFFGCGSISQLPPLSVFGALLPSHEASTGKSARMYSPGRTLPAAPVGPSRHVGTGARGQECYVPSGHMCRHTLSEIRNALGLLKNDPGVVGGSGPGRFALVHDPRV